MVQLAVQGECWPLVDFCGRHRVSQLLQYVSVQYQLERNFNFGIQFIQYAGYQSHHELSSGYPTQSQLSKIEKHEPPFVLFRRIMLQFLSSKQKTTRKLQGTAKPCYADPVYQSPAQDPRTVSCAPTTRRWTRDGMPTRYRQQTARSTDSLPRLQSLLVPLQTKSRTPHTHNPAQIVFGWNEGKREIVYSIVRRIENAEQMVQRHTITFQQSTALVLFKTLCFLVCDIQQFPQ
ncbi:hypothetical protein SS50377_21726 [Spironucleus salmonicida]|uniref:Uncharacterized protein n=1 Tax=Spironucleus salmonicida TaxID=348837 RepID=V6LF75_9EUKA|nr:hypothetical protein SS50377_21711 [Spironucleus salmonicida]KAH0576167.1 hypothetical protein SS50377_21726 [Spironucleus salmonicida]|eukprot:EST43170.1 Hypothetical protein SS50377_17178 [Spironucleus salmonicida]